MSYRSAPLGLLLAYAASAGAQPLVTEIMYDPVSAEPEWEWIELFNPGPAPLDLDGYYVDRVGDRALGESAPASIRRSITEGDTTLANTTVVPAGGVAILYNGDGLAWRPDRFRNAWPGIPGGVALVGVDGWAGSSLNNAPAPPIVDESLGGLTFGFWPSEASYRADTTDLGDADAPDERVVGVASTSFSFVYDDLDPWPNPAAGVSIAYVGAGSARDGARWLASEAGVAAAYQSTATFLAEPLNGADFGSPGVAPAGPGPSGLLISEVLYNPESITGSREWEWVEVYNGGPAVDFAATPHWLDDDDGAELAEPNVTAGVIAAGGVGVLFDADATDAATLAAAWGAGVNFIPVNDWSRLNNAGDVVGLWSDGDAYAADFAAGDTVAGAAAGVVFDDAAPWPSDNGREAIWLTSLAADPLDPASWSRADGDPADPNARLADAVFAPGGVADNSGADVGSPGFFVGATAGPLVGDYNGDGRVDAADYTRWRDGGPLLNETASPGSVSVADFQAWSAAYGAGGATAAVPGPATLPLLAIIAGYGCIRPPQWV